MSDWELVTEDNTPSSNGKISNFGDWELVTEQNEPLNKGESFGKSAALAIPRIGEDIFKSLYHGIQNIPNYYEAAKTEYPGFYSTLYQHPQHALQQGAAGLAELGHGLLNLPHGLAEYGANRLNLLPQSVPENIPYQKDISSQLNQAFDSPKYPGEALIRGMGRNALNIAGGIGGISALKIPTRAGIKNSLLNPHDALENKAVQGFNTVSNEINKRNISNVPLWNQDINMGEIRSYFPKTRQYDELFSKAHEGDYNALRKIQTDLYTSGKKNLGSSLEADRMKGAEMFEKREDINNAISNHLQNTGNHDLNDILNAARNDFHTLQKIYYNKNMNPAIINMVDKNYRKIPKNFINVLQEESKPMQALRDFHPGLESALKKHIFYKNALGKIGKYVAPPALGALGGYGAYKAMSPNENR
jgi:hypothetical protein